MRRRSGPARCTCPPSNTRISRVWRLTRQRTRPTTPRVCRPSQSWRAAPLPPTRCCSSTCPRLRARWCVGRWQVWWCQHPCPVPTGERNAVSREQVPIRVRAHPRGHCPALSIERSGWRVVDALLPLHEWRSWRVLRQPGCFSNVRRERVLSSPLSFCIFFSLLACPGCHVVSAGCGYLWSARLPLLPYRQCAPAHHGWSLAVSRRLLGGGWDLVAFVASWCLKCGFCVFHTHPAPCLPLPPPLHWLLLFAPGICVPERLHSSATIFRQTPR